MKATKENTPELTEEFDKSVGAMYAEMYRYDDVEILEAKVETFKELYSMAAARVETYLPMSQVHDLLGEAYARGLQMGIREAQKMRATEEVQS